VLEAEVAKFVKIFMQDGEDMTKATGPGKGAVEVLAAAEGVRLGEFGPGAGGGKLPEDAVEEKAFRPGDSTRGALLFGWVAFLEGGFFVCGELGCDERGDEEPVAVGEERDGAGGLTGIGA